MNAIAARPVTRFPVDIERKDGEPEIADAIKALGGRFDEHHAAVAKIAESTKSLTERMDKFELKLGRPGGGSGNEDLGAHETERKALGTWARTGNETELKALQVADDAQAGYLVAPELSKTINQKIFDQSPMRRLSRVISISQGSAWEEPVDFSDLGADWVAETASRPETTNPNVAMLTIPVNEIYAHQTVTQKLLDQSFIDIGAWIEGKIGDKFARTEGAATVNGNAVGKPKGFLTYPVDTADDASRALWTLQYKVSGSSATVADVDGQANGIKDLFWSLRAPYRQEASWLMSSATANAVDKLKDSNKNYIWRDGMTAGAPPSLLGRPVEFCEDMPAIGANTFPIAFGDFRRGYTIVDQVGIRVLRDPYTAKPNVIVYAYRRVGGGVSNSEAIKLLKCATS